jgi:integrase
MERWREPWLEQDKRTKNWHLRWRERGDDGVIHRRGHLVESFTQGVKEREAKRLEILGRRAATSNPQAPIRPLYDVYMKEMESVRNLREGALRAKRQALLPWMKEFTVLGELSRITLRDYRDDLLDTDLSPVTVAIRLREVKAFVRWLHFEGHLKENPWVKIELPQYEPTPRFLTDDELARLEAATDGLPFRALFRMAYLTGMRMNEILQSTWEDIVWVKTRAFLTVRVETSKTRRARAVPLRREVVQLLGSRRKGPIFPGWTKWKIRNEWDKAKEVAKIEGRARFHDLRHTFCKIYLTGGGTVPDLMETTGHQSIVMMKIYAHFANKYRAERVDAIHLPDNLMRSLTGRPQDTEDHLEVIEGDTTTPEVTDNDQDELDFGTKK